MVAQVVYVAESQFACTIPRATISGSRSPAAVRIGDIVLLEHTEYRVVDGARMRVVTRCR